MTTMNPVVNLKLLLADIAVGSRDLALAANWCTVQEEKTFIYSCGCFTVDFTLKMCLYQILF